MSLSVSPLALREGWACPPVLLPLLIPSPSNGRRGQGLSADLSAVALAKEEALAKAGERQDATQTHTPLFG